MLVHEQTLPHRNQGKSKMNDRTISTFVLLIGMTVSAPSMSLADDIAQSLSKYPAEIHTSPSKQPDFKGRDKPYREYRTRIREGLEKQGTPNFAGHYNLINIGLTGGAMLVVVDAKTGRVKFADVLGGGPYWDMTFSAGSRLLFLQWSNGEECHLESYEWTDPVFVERTSKLDGTDAEGFCKNELPNGKR